MSLKHKKKRNSGLIYEFLVRRMASTMVDRDPEGYMEALKITKKYFSAGQPLATEKEMFDVISSSRGLSENHARRILGETRKHVMELDARKIDIKKSNLIKDVHYKFGQDFFSVHRVPEYRLMASIQMLIEMYRTQKNTLTEDVQRVQLEEGLVKYMMSSPTDRSHVNSGEKVDGLVASLAMKKFEERYSGSMNEGQKRTLRRFMNYSMIQNKDQFAREMEEEKSVIVEKLEKSRGISCFKEDKVMAQRLDEAISYLKEMNDMTSEKSVEDILLYHKLSAEIDADE